MAARKLHGWVGLAAGLASAALAACDPGPGAPSQGPAPGGGPAPVVADGAAALRADPRLAYLLAPCAQGAHYDVNTADVPALLAHALQHGQRDALRRSKQELAELGREGLEVARRIMRHHWNLPDERTHVRNAIDVVLLSDLPLAREILLEALEHPAEDLRLLALEGLARSGRAEDWDALREALNQASSTYFARAVSSMYAVDRTRTAELVLGWVEAGELEPYWNDVLPSLAGVDDPRVVERCRALWKDLPAGYAIPLAAPCARAGDEDALAALRAWTTSEDATERRVALVACGQAELFDELARALQSDPSPENRKLAASLLATPPERIERTREALVSGCSDADGEVAAMCLRLLADAGDATSIERGFALLSEEGGGGVRAGLQMLGQTLSNRPDLAERARRVLLEQLEREAHRSLPEQAVLLVSLGRLPLRAAAEYLLARADEVERLEGGGPETLQGLRTWHWFALQAGNVGEQAQPLLLERFARETDPVRRIDLLEALTLRGGDAARDRVLELIAAEKLGPYELLYAAERLVLIGPAEIVAPALKRATLRTDQDDVRRALQCLLWSSYPGPTG